MKRKSPVVDKTDVKNAYQLFYDVKRSDAFIKEYESEFMFSSTDDNSPEGDDHFVDASEMDMS